MGDADRPDCKFDQPHIERKCHVVANDFKPMVVKHALDVAPCTSEIIIDADDIGALFDQALAEMRAEKSGPSSNYYAESRGAFG